MIWYLLYVLGLRSSSTPPRLSATHPIRRAFYRHGKFTAQHWLVAMLVSVAIAMGFSYPTIFLSDNPTSGMAAYPHHVWTTAKPFEGDPGRADVEMRQVWVHGTYMKALDKDALKSALSIQQKIVGQEQLTTIFPYLNEKLRESTLSWGYHSPLMYWNNSEQIIDADDDILNTINDQARETSQLDVSLRPASVFAGKKFSHRKLTAADALVLTLMNKVENDVGDKWKDRMASIADGECVNCTIFPHDGNITRNRVYEFSFMPLSLLEHAMFAFAYGCMVLYVILSLRKMRAFHSRSGLVVTAITQMTCSILASFTICSTLKINLSMIPQSAYPFVILVIGLENMFRIINAIVAYPATMATELRIANALGDVGPVSVATAAQNLLILSTLSRLLSPGVAAFCAFACIATLFDVFFLLTFFVAVLNVDIRRFELQDALARSRARQRRKPSPPQQNSWMDALMQGRLPFSTRMAGTAVTTTFVLSLNYHFFEHQNGATSLGELMRLLKKGPPTMSEFDTFAPPPINASLTPGQWIRMQDFDTAKEVMRLAKPGADSFVIRIFAPLIVILAGADRTDMDKEEAWSTALRNFAVFNFYPVIVAIVFIVCFVAVLMNFLLYSEHLDNLFGGGDSDDDEAIRLRTVELPHKLDIIKLAGSDTGHFVSVGLDRSIAIAQFDKTHQAYSVASPSVNALASLQWPIHHLAIDEGGEWIACHCASDQTWLYRCTNDGLAARLVQYPDDNPPLLFRFVNLPTPEGSKLHFMVLTSGGRLVMHRIDSGETSTSRIGSGLLLGADIIETSSQSKWLITVTDDASVAYHTWANNTWTQTLANSLPIPTQHGKLTGLARFAYRSDLADGIVIVTLPSAVVFLDSQSLATVSKFTATSDAPDLHSMLLGQTAACPTCGLGAIKSATLVASDSEANTSCTLTSLHPATETPTAAICLRPSTPTCHSFPNVRTTHHALPSPGAWAPTTAQTILGLRKPAPEIPAPSHLRQRRHARSSTQTDTTHWEAYSLSLDGELETIDASPPAEDGRALYVTEAGPAVALDSKAVAVAFGNVVKVVGSTRRGSVIGRRTGRTLERRVGGVGKRE